MAQKLIIVANRLPFKIEKEADKYKIRQSSGGLVSALRSVPQIYSEIIWIGTADFKEKTWNKARNSVSGEKWEIEPIFMDNKLYSLYYNGFSNSLIWPLFHYFPSFAEVDQDAFQAYQEVNRIFAERVNAVAKAGDIIWVHDYHLMLLPQMIKENRPDVSVGFFLHIPFPSYELLKQIPESWRTAILQGVLHSDVAGFHTEEYLNHFKRSVSFFTNLPHHNSTYQTGNHSCIVRSYPISIDFKQFNNAYDASPVKKAREKIHKDLKNQKIVFSVDRLDYTKGILNRLHSIENLFETNPEYLEKVIFIISIVPSRDHLVKYAERKRMIEEMIGKINGLYGNMLWQPVLYQYRHLTFNQLVSLYSAADIALVTPLRDGMNLVAKEFVASRKDKRGVLVLSEFTGAALELTEAILVNPNDVVATKEGILKGLRMEIEEQESRMKQMQQVLMENDVEKWTRMFFSDITRSRRISQKPSPHTMTALERKEILNAYKNSSKRLLLLDYDGTLVPFFTFPADAAPSSELKKILERLSSDPSNNVVLISGRDADTLGNWFGELNISLVAEHGTLYRKPGGSWTTNITTRSKWKDPVAHLMHKYVSENEGCFIEEKKHSLALHYRRLESRKAARMQTSILKELSELNAVWNFRVIGGNMVVEVADPGCDKGSFVTELLRKNSYDFVLAIGDDRTDEDMFAALSGDEYYTIKVGTAATAARCNLISVIAVNSFLEELQQQIDLPVAQS